MKMKYGFLLLAALSYGLLAKADDTWTDVTSLYLTNPTFEDNNVVSGWVGTTFGAANPMENAEHWNKTFNTYQTLTDLTPGRYRLSLKAFYRCGTAQEDYAYYLSGDGTNRHAVVYATTSTDYYETPLPHLGSGALAESLGGGTAQVSDGSGWGATRYHVPNNMEAAHWWFEAGYYQNMIQDIIVGSDGEMTIGVSKEVFVNQDWMCLDDWKLEFNGKVTIVETPTAKAGDVLANEVMAANVDQFVDPSWNYGGFLELYNPTDQEVTLAGCWVSDDPNNLQKALIHKKVGKVPARGFRTLWFDHADTRKDIGEGWTNTQLDMKLDCEGGTLYISDPEGNLILQQDYPAAVMRCSYARTEDAGSDWNFSDTPTPGESNAGMTFATVQLAAPEVDLPGQLFTGSLRVRVSIPQGATLRYTTDGTTPDADNGQTSTDGLFDISTSTVFRFRLFQEGYLPSQVTTRSYILKDKDYYLPVVSLVTDPDNLYDNTIGIYVTGTNGKTANQDNTKRNFNMDWERPASFEFIDNRGLRNTDGYFAQEVDIAINGGWSRKYEPKSFKVKSNKLYGLKKSLDYPFFADKPYHKHKQLLLRNGGNDEYNQTRLKDVSLQEIARVSEFPLNLQSHQPVHVFVNGSYLAMLNLREPSNRNFGVSNYGMDDDEMDSFEMSVDSGYVQKSGTKEAFLTWKSLSEQAADELTYQQICDLVDIDDYTNYMAFKFYLNDWDWPHNNAKGFRSRQDGKFHFMVFDLDNCVDRTGNNIFQDFAGKQVYTFYSRPEYGWTSITAEVELVTIFLNMLQNEEFRRLFIDKYCLVGGSVFGDEEELARIVNGVAERIAPALSWEGHTPYGTGRSFAQGIINAVTGNYRQRMTEVIQAYPTFGLSGTEAQEVTVQSNVPTARLSLNGITIPRNRFDGYLFAPVTLQAEAPAGYRFTGWWGRGNGITSTVFGTASEWDYYDNGSLDGEDWTSPDYNTQGWHRGTAPFGYGNAGKPMANATTQLNRDDGSGNRITTCYLRREFQLEEVPKDGDVFRISYEVDDSHILYVNGQEVDIYHLWSGATYDETCQSRGNYNWYEGDNPYTHTVEVPANLLRKGSNVVAVEVHNCNATSSDLWWEASMNCTSASGEEGECLSTEASYELPSSGGMNLMARFEPLSADELAEEKVVPLHVNEVSAGNSVDVNDYYKKDDWIEIYNSTDEDIDLAGMYLSDNAEKPTKFQVPGDLEGLVTVVPAHGHLIVWASKRDIKGSEIHANFKLANDADVVSQVILTSADLTWSDTLTYTQHAGDESYGRYPDGGNRVYQMARPTLAARNILDSYSNFAYEYIYNGIPEPGEDETPIQGISPDDILSREYYDLKGISVGSDLHGLSSGIYVVKYRMKNGKTRQFIVHGLN